MSRIRDRNTRPELTIRRALWAQGLRYRVLRRIAGVRPDILFTKAKVAVFIDGCFWHGCPRHYTFPRTKRDFWAKKLRENVNRDIRQTRTLNADGLIVLRFWTHEIAQHPDDVISTITAAVCHGTKHQLSSWRVSDVEPLANDQERRHLISLDEKHRAQIGKRNTNSYRTRVR